MAKLERWASCADNHGVHADPKSCGVLFEFLKWWRPTVRIHLGDCFDFAALRRGANDEEKRESIRDDMDAGLAFLDQLKPTHFLRGNHDERAWDLLDTDNGPLRDLGSGFVAEIVETLGDIPILPYDKRKGVLRYGDHSFIHGYHSGVYAAANAAKTYGACLMGHVHSIDVASVPRFDQAIGRTIGAMCQVDQRYNRGHAGTLRQMNGFCYGIKTQSGKLIVYQAQAIDGQWFFPSEIREVRCR
jgi:hypothetical protein